MNIILNDISQRALQTDDNGYVKIYRTSISVNITYKNMLNGKVKTMKLTNYDDYIVDDDSTKTEENRVKSIKNSINKILNNFTSYIAIESIKKDDIN